MPARYSLLALLVLHACGVLCAQPAEAAAARRQPTKARDVAALLAVKAGLQVNDPEGVLPFHTWVPDTDPCLKKPWVGVTCSGGRVLGLVLRPPYVADPPSLFGSIPAAIGNLTALHTLDLSYNENITGSIPPQMGRLELLQTLDLSGTRCKLGEEFAVLKKLKTLIIAEHPEPLADSPTWLGKLTKLKHLSLKHTTFKPGPIPLSFGKLKRLKTLDLTGTSLTGDALALGGLRSLTSLILSYNNLSSISSTLGGLSSLQVLKLDNNNVSGMIPPELGQLKELVELDASYNRLKGPIPAALFNIQTLASLDLSNNKLTGPIPREVKLAKALEQLFVNDNGLTGPIPKALAKAAKLGAIDVSHNKLTGVIPAGWNNTYTAVFASNYFTDPAPHFPQFTVYEIAPDLILAENCYFNCTACGLRNPRNVTLCRALNGGA